MIQRDSGAVASRPQVELQAAQGHYALEITTTFAVEPDPFALQTEGGEQKPALLVRLADKEILRVTERLESGVPIGVEPLTELTEGTNEIYLEASAPLEQAGKSHAVRVRVLRDGQTVAERSFWSGSDGRVADTMRFVAAIPRDKDEGHGHE
jgi:hypothetical protein